MPPRKFPRIGIHYDGMLVDNIMADVLRGVVKCLASVLLFSIRYPCLLILSLQRLSEKLDDWRVGDYQNKKK